MASVPVKITMLSRFDTTDALPLDTPVRPYNRYSSVRPNGAFLGVHRSPLERLLQKSTVSLGAVDTLAEYRATLSAPELCLDELSYYLCTVYLF